MKKSAELKQERAQKIKAQQESTALATTETRTLNAEEATLFRSLQTEIEGLTAQIAMAEQAEENQRSLVGSEIIDLSGSVSEKREFEKLKKRFDIGTALRMAGSKSLSGVEKEINDIAIAEMKSEGRSVKDFSFNIPASMVRSDAHTKTEDGGAYGGKLVVNQAPRLVDSFIPKTFLEEMGATLWTGLTGGDVPLPVMENFEFGWYGETEKINSQKKGVDGPVLSSHRAGAVVLISNRLLSQSSVDVQSKIMMMLGNGAKNALNNAAINGLGSSNQPLGLLGMSGILAGSSSAAAFPTWALVNELKGKILNADSTQNSLGYLCDPTLMAYLETAQKANGTGFIAENGKIGGYNTVATSLVKPIGSAPELHSLIFGDFSQLFIGQWGGISFIVDPLTEADSNSLKVTVNMEADVQVANKKAFAKNNFFKTV